MKFSQKATQHSVHPTGGSLRVFRQVAGWRLVPSKRRSLVPPTSGYRLLHLSSAEIDPL